MSLTEQEIVRYSRHIILSEVGGRGQRKLKGASVLLAGLGAAGSAAGLYLAAAGIGRLTLWDPGLLTPQDLESGIAHDVARVGMPRSRSAAAALTRMNPDAVIEVLDRESDVAGTVPAHQVVLASMGDWDDLVAAALAAGTAAVLCGVHGAAGAVGVVRRESPCLTCLGAERARGLGLHPEGGAAAIAAAAGVIGVVAATETVKLILGIGTPLTGRVLLYDGWSATFREESYERNAGCPVCGG